MFQYIIIFILGMIEGAILRDWYMDKQTLKIAVKRGKK